MAILKVYGKWMEFTSLTREFCEDGSSGKLVAKFLLPSYCEMFYYVWIIVRTHHSSTGGKGNYINKARFQNDVDRNLTCGSKSVIHSINRNKDQTRKTKSNEYRTMEEVKIYIRRKICVKIGVLDSSFTSSSFPNPCSLFLPSNFPNLSFLLSSFHTTLSCNPVHGEVHIECMCEFSSLNAILICRTMWSSKPSKLSLQHRTLRQLSVILLPLASWTLFLEFILKFHPSREDHRTQLRRQIMKLTYHEIIIKNTCRPQVSENSLESNMKTRKDENGKLYLPIGATLKASIMTKTTEFFRDEYRSVYDMKTAHDGKNKEWHFPCNFYKFSEMFVFPVFRRNDLEYSFMQMLEGVPQFSSDIMRFEHHRLSSFANYSNDNAPSSLLMAKSGWYATGNGNETKTFCCLIVYSVWNGRDNPYNVHRDLNPDCAFFIGSRDLGQVTIQENMEGRSYSPDGTYASNVSEISTNLRNTHTTTSNLENTSTQPRMSVFDSMVIQSKVDELAQLSSKADRNACSSWSIDCPSRSLIETSRPQTVPIHTHSSNINNMSPETNTNQTKPNLEKESSTKNECDNTAQASEQNFREFFLPPLMSVEPKHREYSTVSVRTSSFSGFPTASRKTPKEFAIGGFYYRGFGDRTTCFHCGISLQGWSTEDDVFVEHVRNNPLCQYMRGLKGDDFVKLVMSVTPNQQMTPLRSEDQTGPLTVQSVLDEIFEDASNEPINSGVMNATWNSTCTSEGSAQNIDSVTRLQTANQRGGVARGIDHGPSNYPSTNTLESKDQFICKICMEEKVAIVFTPCGHIVTCSECCRSLRKCPICREFIRDKIPTVITD
ncbi:E3 ubiquitin-protein ligase XIAP-like isoform X2 [Ostrea edulis]|uniref:E3 ubiquitin-protein ligase XIAP-like isoform X2 n=1 Tax=Ostrea edulis TaxID=37623 RepID=UPI0024AFBA81|nr:E3 ubiquitin-protein ligase XIAP-like isoform X2 [Ostrea edulis]